MSNMDLVKKILKIFDKIKCLCNCKSSCMYDGEEHELVNFKKSLTIEDLKKIKKFLNFQKNTPPNTPNNIDIRTYSF